MASKSLFMSLLLIGSTLAAPTAPATPAPICGRVGVVGKGVTADPPITGQYATPSQCSADAQVAGYQSFSYHHTNNSCTFYHQPAGALGFSSTGYDSKLQMFWDTSCGDYRPTCNIVMYTTLSSSQNADVMKTIDVGEGEVSDIRKICAGHCAAMTGCFSISAPDGAQQCNLYRNTATGVASLHPVQMPVVPQDLAVIEDVYCYEPY